jgi:hypothetical protein
MSSIEAAQARIAELEERITTQALQIAAFEAQAQEAMRGWREAVARLSAQRPLVEAARRLEGAWEALCDCVAEFEPDDMQACGEYRGALDDAILAVLAAYRAAQEGSDGTAR